MIDRSSSPELSRSPDSRVDPELVSLPHPPRQERTLSVALMVVTALFALALAAGLWGDVRYALLPSEPDDVRNLASLLPDPGMENRFVRGQGALDTKKAVRYERALERGSFELLPLVNSRKVWVEMRVADGDEQMDRLPPPTTFVGRLVPMRGAWFRIRSLRAVGSVPDSATEDAWVLIDGATPASLGWTVALFALLSAFAAYNLLMIARIVRPVR